jgi:L-iditol 2-dehydrogenase
MKKVAPEGADKVIVSVGDIHVAEESIRLVSKGGILNVYAGMPKGQMMMVDPYRIHYDEVNLVGTFGFAPRHFHQAVSMLPALREDLEKIISGSVPLDEILTALKAMAEYHGIKYVVEFAKD